MANSNGAELASTLDIPPDQAKGEAWDKDTPNEAAKAATERLAQETRKQKRTPGLWVLDNLLYTVLNNLSVFAVSVAATYITQNDKVKYTGLRGWLQSRGQRVTGFLMGKGLSENSAKNASMVAFSFLDGSIMAPAIKLLEDHREPLAEKIDIVLGTVPEDKSVYDAEPKQSWWSIGLGRISALALVLPVAVALDKFGKNHENKWGFKTEAHTGKNPLPFRDINTIWFREPGERAGKLIMEAAPGLTKRFTNPSLLFRTSIFEAVYTTICTVGLYVGSRFFARKSEERHQLKATHAIAPEHAAANDEATPQTPVATATTKDQPTPASHTAPTAEATQQKRPLDADNDNKSPKEPQPAATPSPPPANNDNTVPTTKIASAAHDQTIAAPSRLAVAGA